MAKLLSVSRAIAKRVMRLSGKHRMAADLRARGDEARAARRFRDAAILYEASLRLRPSPSIEVQAGHMFKEAGDLPAAELHYRAALKLLPDDADLALQFGHFLKISDQQAEAIAYYRRAAALKPNWDEPLREADSLLRRGGFASVNDGAAVSPTDQGLIPELMPLTATRPPVEPAASIEVARLGSHPERTDWGLLPTLRGVEAIRGLCRGAEAGTVVELSVDDRVVRSAKLSAGSVNKRVFNLWHDFAGVAAGVHSIRVECRQPSGRKVHHQRTVAVLPPLREADVPDSDSVVEHDASSNLDVVEQVIARDSMVRAARSALFTSTPRRVLVARADQLGDMVVSVPALRRLRTLLPEAAIVGLVTAGNADLARELGLFDELVEVKWDATPGAPRTAIAPEEQRRLAATLQAHDFDLAIDLSVSGNSRPLLLLTGARVLFGFDDVEWPWLTAGMSGGSHDPRTGAEMAPHAAKLAALIERLGTLLDSGSRVVRRRQAEPDAKVLLNIPSERRFAVIHDGGRFAFARWPGYPALLELLLQHTDLDVVWVHDAATVDGGTPVSPSPRVHFLQSPLPFELFDAVLEGAAVFIGNDSGPKHLAVLRGTPVGSVHGARIDWREWGQEQTGMILTRRVPCAGCAIAADDECGMGYTCIADIAPAEVFAAVNSLL